MERISQAALLKDDIPVESSASANKDAGFVEKTSTPRSPIALINNLLETIKLAPSIDETSSKSLTSLLMSRSLLV